MWNDENLIKILKEGGVAIIPTDTLYGLVGSALNKSTIERIDKIKKRTPTKHYIHLIASLDELQKFNITISPEQQKEIGSFSEPTSFIVDGISFRVPQNEQLRELLLQTGPLVAPSANPEGLPPAQTRQEAWNYFGDLVDIYIDGGILKGKASKLIELHKDGAVSILRE